MNPIPGRGFLGSLGALVLLACARSPYAVARQVSGLPIPPDALVLSFKDEPAGRFGEDLMTRVELQLQPTAFDSLSAEALSLGYQRIGMAGDQRADSVNQYGVSDKGLAEAAAEVPPGGSGLFRYVRESPSSYSLVVLDSARHRVVVQVVIL